MVFRSSAAHQPSSRRRIVLPPHWSVLMNLSGTPVSEISITSWRQQAATQVEQLVIDGVSQTKRAMPKPAEIASALPLRGGHGLPSFIGTMRGPKVAHGFSICKTIRLRSVIWSGRMKASWRNPGSQPVRTEASFCRTPTEVIGSHLREDRLSENNQAAEDALVYYYVGTTVDVSSPACPGRRGVLASCLV